MAAYEVLLLNTAIPQIQAAQSGDTYVVPRDIAINATAIISANSATDALRITQTGAGNALLVEDAANPDSTPFVVTAAGDVGIGTSSPLFKLHVNGSVYANAIQIGDVSAFLSNSPDALIGWAASFSGYTNGTLILQSRSSAATPIVFATGSTSGAEVGRFTAAGNLDLQKNIGLGGTAATTSGTGITFPATASPSSDGNTLDDYEEGTWNPTLGGTWTGYAEGYYIKIGRLVHAYGAIDSVTSLGTGSTDTISGLPVAASNNPPAGAGFGGSAVTFSNLATNVLAIFPYVVRGSSNVKFNSMTAAGTGSTNNAAIFGNNAAIYFCVTYFTA